MRVVQDFVAFSNNEMWLDPSDVRLTPEGGMAVERAFASFSPDFRMTRLFTRHAAGVVGAIRTVDVPRFTTTARYSNATDRSFAVVHHSVGDDPQNAGLTIVSCNSFAVAPARRRVVQPEAEASCLLKPCSGARCCTQDVDTFLLKCTHQCLGSDVCNATSHLCHQ